MEMNFIPETGIDNLQKVADVYDLFDPAVDYIIRNKLRVTPGSTRRVWEFAMIFLALHRANKIHPQARGLALGAGTERLIFSIASEVEKVVVTDLYETDSRWVGVRTEDPQSLVMKRAPWPIPEGRIEAQRMDMREISFPDNSFDFAWSTGSFEHIGDDDDFVRHLNEVHRVLKPGGVYAFTTVVSFGEETHRIPNNYYFHPDHFADLLHRSKLSPRNVFDCSIREHFLNMPMPERLEDYGFEAGNMHIHPIVAWRRGVVNAPNLAVLEKDDAKPKRQPRVTGFAATKRRLWKNAESFTRRLWQDWQDLTLHATDRALTTVFLYFGDATVEIDLTMFAPKANKTSVRILSRRSAPPLDRKVEARLDYRVGGPPLTFRASKDRLYAIQVIRAGGGISEPVRVRARFAR